MANKSQLNTIDVLKLVALLVLAFYIAFIPHLSYQYPIHGDEWVHLAYSESILQAGSTTFIEPFFGQSTLSPISNLETGFHLYWVVFHQITDISWPTIFRYFPSIIFMITVLSVYIFAKSKGFGWEAALFTCLIPTTIGILGPAFLVPVALGLLFIPLCLFLAFNLKTWPSYLLMFVLTLFLLTMHLPSAAIMITIFIPYIIVNIRGNFRHSLGMALALVIPFAASLPWTFDILVNTVRQLATSQPYDTYVRIPSIVQAYGYLSIAFGFLGTIVLLKKGSNQNYGLVFGLLILTAMIVIFFRLHYGVSILYERGLMYLMLMLGIIAGAGLAWLRTLRFPSESNGVLKYFLARNAGNIIFLVFIIAILATGIPARKQTSYYHLIDRQDYQAFVWIRDNLSEDYQKAILNPWQATAFTAITQRNVYTRIHEYPKDRDLQAYDFLRGGCIDTSFLRKNEISIVYSRSDCHNPDLMQIRDKVYVLREREVREELK